MVRHQYVVGNFRDRQYQPDVVYLDALQNRGELNQVEVLTFQDVHLLHLLVVVVGEVLHHQLKMDCCQDAVDVELMRHQLKMDYYLDAELQVLHLLHLVSLKSYLHLLAMGLARSIRREQL
jgi:hypothetical protein